MTTRATPNHRLRSALREAGVAAPILLLLGILLWQAFSERPVASEAGFPAQRGVRAPQSVSAHEPEPTFLVVVGHERAVVLREQLAAELRLHESLGGAPRRAEVVEVRDEVQLDAVLEAIRADARGLSVPLGAIVVGTQAADIDVPATAARPPGR